jgi:hypothetical protein
MAQVNPPPILKIPPNLSKDRQSRDYFRQVETILFQLWQRTGGDIDLIEASSNLSASGFSPQVQFLQQQVNGLPKFTCDTTGFTADSTEWTADKDTV